MPRIPAISLCAITALIFTSTAALLAQEQDDKPRPQDEAEAQYDRIELADPRAVEIGLRWLSESLGKVDDPQFRPKLLAGIATAMEFRLDEAGPNLVTLYKQAGAQRIIRNDIVLCASTIRSRHAQGFLEMLRDDQSISGKSHILVLGALTSLGDDSARKELLGKMNDWSEILAKHSAWREDLEIIPHVLQSLDDDQIRTGLQRLLEAQKDEDVRQKTQRSIDYMEMNHASVDQLLKILASPNDPDSVEKKYTAMVVIGRKASLDVIPRLRKIDTSKIPAIKSSPDHMPFEFSATRDDAIRDIRRHHWDEVAQEPTTRRS